MLYIVPAALMPIGSGSIAEPPSALAWMEARALELEREAGPLVVEGRWKEAVPKLEEAWRILREAGAEASTPADKARMQAQLEKARERVVDALIALGEQDGEARAKAWTRAEELLHAMEQELPGSAFVAQRLVRVETLKARPKVPAARKEGAPAGITIEPMGRPIRFKLPERHAVLGQTVLRLAMEDRIAEARREVEKALADCRSETDRRLLRGLLAKLR